MAIPLLDKDAQEALDALEVHDLAQRAADALGIPRGTLVSRAATARRRGMQPSAEAVKIKELAEYEKIRPLTKPVIPVKAGGSSGGEIYRVLVIGDAHDAPDIPKDRFTWFAKYAEDHGCERIVQIGDWGTFDSLSTHDNTATYAGRLKGAFHDDVRSYKESHEAFAEGLSPGSRIKKHITKGNHDDTTTGGRIGRYENVHPEVVGVMGTMIADIDADHGWTSSQFGEFYFIGGVGFVHVPLNELGKPYGGKTAGPRIANDAIFDIVYGHDHKRRSHRAPKVGPQKHVSVINVGCALPWGHVENYASLSTTGWWWGIVDLTIQGGHVISENAVPMIQLEKMYR